MDGGNTGFLDRGWRDGHLFFPKEDRRPLKTLWILELDPLEGKGGEKFFGTSVERWWRVEEVVVTV